MDQSVRHRKTAAQPASSAAPKRPAKDDESPAGISILDIIRVLLGVLLVSATASWFVTDGDSLLWGYKPQVTRWKNWKSLLQSEIILTDSELSQYDGKTPGKPIYVAVNGSVFDVSANPGMYGPRGGYGFFAGRDAARAFVSGCFQDDLTWDLRGLEEMFITGEEKKEDDAEAAEIYEISQDIKAGDVEKYEGMHVDPERRLTWLKRRRHRRRATAQEKVDKQIRHWDNFFRNHEKYFYAGKVIHPSLEGEPIRKLCTSQGKPSKST